MTEHSFSLVPFPAPDIPDIFISGKIRRARNVLTVHYTLSGDIQSILIPESVSHASRKNELWTSSCFEFFLAIPDRPEYWEFNLSPSGDWNVFQMDAYRRVGFREETRVEKVQLAFLHGSGKYTMDAMVDLNPFIAAHEPVQVGVTTVIQTTKGGETYWALVHPGSQADFHLQESFLLQL